VEPAPTNDIPPPLRRPFQSAARCAHSWIVLALTSVLALAIDLISKHLAFKLVAGAPVTVLREEVLAAGPQRIQTLIPPHEPVTIIPRLLDLQLVLNAGAVFGAGQGRRWFFVVFTVFALAFAFWMFAKWTDRRDRLSHIAIGLLIAGGLGNLYDRMVYACVRDFLHPLPTATLPFGWSWPSGDRLVWPYVSNIADAFLILGIAVLVIKLWRTEEQPKKMAIPPATAAS
jgi:signal peptidase II